MDSIEISGRSCPLRFLQEELQQTAEFRADKVAQIKKDVKAGAYCIPIELLAERLLGAEGDGHLDRL